MKNPMKYIILLLLALSGLFANEIELIPIRVNFNRIEVRNDTILTCGDYGSLLVSYDAAKTWHQVKAFDKGLIQQIFWDGNQMTAFSDYGDVAVSSDGAASWKNVTSLNDSIFAVIRFPKGYFIRSDKKIFTITKDYKRIDEFPLISGYIAPQWPYQYRKSVVWFKNNFVLSTDNAKYFVFNEQLKLTDSLSLNQLGFCEKCATNFQVDADVDFLYLKVDNIIYRTQNMKNIDTFFVTDNNHLMYKLIDKNIFVITKISQLEYVLSQVEMPDSEKVITVFTPSGTIKYIDINDFIIANNALFITGDMKFIANKLFNESDSEVFSYCYGYSHTSIPDKLSDSIYLFNSENYNDFSHFFHISKNDCTTLNPTVEKNNPFDISSYKFYFKHYDYKNSILYMGGSKFSSTGGVLISKDTAKTFEYIPLPNYNFIISSPFFDFKKLTVYPNLFVNDSSFVIASNDFYKKPFTSIQTYDRDFNLKSIYRDSNYVIGYVNSRDTNTFLIYCLNTVTNCFEIRYSSDKGITWENIKTYKKEDSLLTYKELKIGDKNYLIIYNYNIADSICSFQALDIENRSVKILYSFKDTIQGWEIAYRNAMDNVGDTLYLVVSDTIFYTTDLFDKSKWKKYLLPNGAIIRRAFKKFGNRFYARYSDSIHKDNLYWIKILTDTTKYESPSIFAGDIDFGKHDIRKTDYKTKKIKIENNSKDSSLVINGYSKFNDSVFVSNLPIVSESNPLSIGPMEFYEYEVTFKPRDSIAYNDSIVFYSNASKSDNISYLNGIGIDTSVIIKVEDSKTESETYLYIYPPYPVPAKNSVRSLIYWDPRIDIDNDVIGVIDVSGNKIEGRENITIDKLTPYSGFLTWNCAVVAPGIYFIHIKHGNNSRIMKVVISR
jgi:hypothetical protein